jgi:HEPN domain-containing protein
MEVDKVKAAMANAETWLGSANSNYRDKHFSASLYSLEMSAEIALKAVLLSVNVNVPRIHDVSAIVIKYSNENKKLAKIKENEKFVREVFSDLLMFRNSAGYMFEYRKSEKEFKELIEEYLPQVKLLLGICKASLK